MAMILFVLAALIPMSYGFVTYVVEEDPHFMIQTPGERFCFDVSGVTGEVLHLIEDDVTGVVVTGDLTQLGGKSYSPSYFTKIDISTRSASAFFTAQGITLGSSFFLWTDKTLAVQVGDISIKYDRDHNVLVTIQDDILLRVNTDGKIMNIFVNEVGSLSHYTKGIIGQFMYSDVHISNHNDGHVLRFGDRDVALPVSLDQKRGFSIDGPVPCWVFTGKLSELLGDKDSYVSRRM